MSISDSGRQQSASSPSNNSQDRIQVFARIRPFSTAELEMPQNKQLLCVNEEYNELQLLDQNQSQFQFDRVFDMVSDNGQIFDVVGLPVVDSAMRGFNGTLLTYGQTGTGKTFTFNSDDGQIPRMVNYLFQRIGRDQRYEYTIKCSGIQIYNERVYDLLRPSVSNDPVGLENELYLRECPDRGVFVESLTEYVVRSPSETFDLIETAKSRLIFAETKMNRASSRSHALTFLAIERKVNKKRSHNIPRDVTEFDDLLIDEEELLDDQIVMSKITLCDLAGSERIKKTMAIGERLNEAQQINLSLLELGNVIQALSDPKRGHIPFRNSILTRLLTESLGGNCLTRLVVCVSPCFADLSETKSTLSFGMRAMRVNNNARRNVTIDYQELSETLQKLLMIKDDDMRKRDLEWQRRLDTLIEEQQNQENEQHLKTIGELQALIETVTRKLAVPELDVWISIQSGIHHLEQKIYHDKVTVAGNVHISELSQLTRYSKKAKYVSQIVEWLMELFLEPTVKTVNRWVNIHRMLMIDFESALMQLAKRMGEQPDEPSQKLSTALDKMAHGFCDSFDTSDIGSDKYLINSVSSIIIMLQMHCIERIQVCANYIKDHDIKSPVQILKSDFAVQVETMVLSDSDVIHQKPIMKSRPMQTAPLVPMKTKDTSTQTASMPIVQVRRTAAVVATQPIVSHPRRKPKKSATKCSIM